MEGEPRDTSPFVSACPALQINVKINGVSQSYVEIDDITERQRLFSFQGK